MTAISLPPAADRFYGSGPALLHDPVATFYEGWRRGGDVVRFRLPPLPISIYLVAAPDDVKRVLHDPRYQKVPAQNEKVKAILGEGLFTSDGDRWRRQRRLMQAAFHRDRTDSLVRTTAAATGAMLERWRARADPGRPLDIHGEMTRLTLAILLRLLFSHDADADFERLERAIAILDRHLNLVEQASFLAPRWVPSPKSRRASLARRTIDEAVLGYIAGRRRASAAPDDLLSLMLDATYPDTGGRMDDGQIRDEIVTLLMGDRITAPTLLWTWWLLGGHPAVEQRVRHEVADVLEGRPATSADVPNLRYGASVLAEVLRLYPSAWLTARVPVSDDTLGDYRIPAGTRVVVCPYITHRHPRYWRDPEGFDPDRFYAGPDADRPHYAYFPFGGGPRNCIASTFAVVEAQVIVAAVLQECRLRAVPGTTVRVGANPLLMPTPVPFMTVEWSPAVASAGRDAPMRAHSCPFATA